VTEAARRLEQAAQQRVPCRPVRDLIGSHGVEAAYAVQEQLVSRREASGAVVIGRKIGLTSAAVQAQLGVDQPDFGVLFDDMRVADRAVVPMGGLLQPRIEAEIAFVLHADLDEGALDLDHVRGAVAGVSAAIEIVDSRIAGWDISFADTVADNGSSALFVVGTDVRPVADVALVEAQMVMSCDGTVVSSGTGAACLGNPLEALAWLARTARDFGRPLRAGEVVLSGALGPMVDVVPGGTYVARVTGLGSVSVSFENSTEGMPA
jgi:2-keto-4-pentenoate hydratase